MKVDSETADLIVQTYQNIHKLKALLNHKAFNQLKGLLESGDRLNEMMSNVLLEFSDKELIDKLDVLSRHLKTLLAHAADIQNIQGHEQVTDLFHQLLSDISVLQSKIKVEQ